MASSDADYDGDGVANADDPCMVVPQSGQDDDSDGVDDACDGAITDPNIAPEDIPALPAISPLTLDGDAATEDAYVDSFIAPYVPPKQEEPATPTIPETPKDDDSAKTPADDANADSGDSKDANTDDSTTSTESPLAVTATTAAQPATVITAAVAAATQTEASDPSVYDGSSEAQSQSVLGEAAAIAVSPKSSLPKNMGAETGHSRAGTFALLAVSVCGLAALLLLLKRRHD